MRSDLPAYDAAVLRALKKLPFGGKLAFDKQQAVQALLRQSQDWGTLELQRARRALARGEAVDQVMAQLACGLTRKLMHGTLAGLHHSSGAEHQAWVQTAQRCFLGDASDAAEPVAPHGRH